MVTQKQAVKATYAFLLNLRSETADRGVLKKLKPQGFLLSVAYDTKSILKIAHELRTTQKFKLFADNGNFTLVSQICKKYAAKSKLLLTKVQKIEKRNGHYLRVGETPSELRLQYQKLASAIEKDAAKLCGTGDSEIAGQLAMNPSHLIGVEDITIASWLALNLELSYTGLALSAFSKKNKRVCQLARRRIPTLDERLQPHYYPVASAVSYDTAFDAGKIFGAAGFQCVSMGFGAYMSDDNYNDHVIIKRKIIELGMSVPNRYTRTVLAARGFWDGYLKASNTVPEAFHFLGLGAPIMMALVSLCAWGTKELTFDATSPIKDAVTGTLYFSRPSYLKSRTRDIALRLARSDLKSWHCGCPFCREFNNTYPIRYSEGHAWYKSAIRDGAETQRLEVGATDLAPGGRLYNAYPILSEPMSGARRRDVDFARMNHNHWILTQITKELTKHSTSYSTLKKFVTQVVTSYCETTKSEHFAKAIQVGLELSTATPTK